MRKVYHIEFEKYHGAGNDFLFINYNSVKSVRNIENLKNLSRVLCHRRNGVGADGVVLFDFEKKTRRPRSKKVPNSEITKLLIFNSDGSLAATCGNALRCLGLKLLVEKKWDGKSQLQIMRLVPKFLKHNKVRSQLTQDELFILQDREPFACLVQGVFKAKSCFVDVSVAMGNPVEIKATPLQQGASPFGSAATTYSPVFVSLANPHWVFVSSEFQNFSKKDFVEFGKLAQTQLRDATHQEAVPLANIGMLVPHQQNKESWDLVVYERGAGLTACCGSGAVAARVALEFLNLIPQEKEKTYFKMPGGLVAVSRTTFTSATDKQRILSGPAQKTFTGTISITSPFL
jgi:diaminopimelate epimerase